MQLTKMVSIRTILLSLLLALSLIMTACASTTGEGRGEQETEEMEHEEDEHMEEEHEEEHEHEEEDRIPNAGASINILSPGDGATIAENQDIIVEVEVGDFALGEDGNHWHVYVDGTSWGMVVGGRTEEAVRGLEPGEHKIEVFLTGGDHVELLDGDTIAVMVE